MEDSEPTTAFEVDKDVKLDYDQPEIKDFPTVIKEVEEKIDADLKNAENYPEWMHDMEIFEGWLNRMEDIAELRRFAEATGLLIHIDLANARNVSRMLRSGDPMLNYTELLEKFGQIMAKYQPFFSKWNDGMLQKFNSFKSKIAGFYTELRACYNKIMSRIRTWPVYEILDGRDLLNDSNVMELHVRAQMVKRYSAKETLYINYGVKLTLWQRFKTLKWQIKNKMFRVVKNLAAPKINMHGKESAVGTGAQAMADLGAEFGVMVYEELQRQKLERDTAQIQGLIDMELDNLSPRQRAIVENLRKYTLDMDSWAELVVHWFRDNVKTKIDRKLARLTKEQVYEEIKKDNAKKHRPMTVPGQNYEGPGNYLYSGKPTDKADVIALKHDWHYHLSQYQEDISDADKQAIEEFGEEYDKTGSFNGFIGWLGIKAKKFIEEYIVGHVIYPVRYAVWKT